MHETIKPVEKVKMLTLISLLSKYDLFHISVSDGQEFNATEIVNNRSSVLKFKRMFATAKYTNNDIVRIKAISNDKFLCETETQEYYIQALHIRPSENIIREHRTWRTILDFVDISFIGDEYTFYSKEKNSIILVVDPYLLGEITSSEYTQIKRIINLYLNGCSQSMQMSRTICFQIQFDENEYIILAGLYDLEMRCQRTYKLIYNSKNSKSYENEFKKRLEDIVSYAKEKIVKT